MTDQDSVNSSNRRRLLRATAVGLTGTGLFGSAAAQESDDDPTVISEPITITEPGTYVLKEDLVHEVTEETDYNDFQPFIQIDTDFDAEGEIVIDGQGHEIAGHGYATGIGGRKIAYGSVTVTTRDLTLRNLNQGFYFNFAPNLNLESITITDCTGSAIGGHLDATFTGTDLDITDNRGGISIVHGHGVITDSTITGNENNGVLVTDTDIENTTISRNGRGVYIASAGQLTITGSTIQRNDEDGIDSSDTFDVTVTDSNISHNGRHGINAVYATEWNINQNVINHNGEYGAYLENFDNGRVVDSTIVGNDIGAIFLSDDSEGNVIEDNRTGGPPDRGNGNNDNPSPPNGDNGNGNGKQKGHGKRKRKKSKSSRERQ